jgi:predicted dehydrogenase
VRVAVLGLGSAGTRHALFAAELGHGVLGFDPAGVGPSAVPRAGSEEEAIDACEAVVIATPSALHASQAVRALEAGRHALVEKPLATTVEDAERVAEAAERSGRVCGMAMNLRFHPGILALRRLLHEGRLGTPLLARASFGYDLRRWRPGTDYRLSYSARAELGGGIVLDAIHELDYLVWLLGPVAAVSGETAHLSSLDIDVEDAGVGILRFTTGALATVDLNFFEPAYRRSCVIVGEQAAASWDWNAARVTIRPLVGEQEHIQASPQLEEMYRDVLRDFLHAADGGASVRTSVRAGLEVLEVAAALKASSAQGRRIEMPAPQTRSSRAP